MGRRTWLTTPCHSRASGNPGVPAGFQICPRNDKKKKTEKEWIPAFAGMTKKRKTGKKKNKKNFMLFMYFMVNFRVAVNGYNKSYAAKHG